MRHAPICLTVALFACGTATEPVESTTADSASTSATTDGWLSATTPDGSLATSDSATDTDPGPPPPAPPGALAAGVSIDKVSLYQGVERVVYTDNPANITGLYNAPTVAQREALLQVAVLAPDDASARTVEIVATFSHPDGTEATFRAETTARPHWNQISENSAPLFSIPGEWLTPNTQLDVSVHEVESVSFEGGTDQAELALDPATLGIQPENEIHIVIVPVEYNADGSGRLPDVSPDQIALWEHYFAAMFPVSTARIEVEAPLPWNHTIGSLGSGWDTILDAITDHRDDLNVPDETYVYGLFNPDDTFFEFCSGGCVAGLSWVLTNPSSAWARASVGVGFSGLDSVYTAIHEVGHAQGRSHAPCGSVSGADLNYPYDDADIGVWGYDGLSTELLSPTGYADIMSYCGPQWVSDYTYAELYDWGLDVAASSSIISAEWQTARMMPDGSLKLGKTVTRRGAPGSKAVRLALQDASGANLRTVTGWLTEHGHGGGGVVMFAPQDIIVSQATVVP